jgi:hypothetical protein
MPNNSSYADLVRDLDRLLEAFKDNAEILAPAEQQRAALQVSLDRMKDLKARQDSCAAKRQEATQELAHLMLEAREDARRLRGMVKGLLGTKNERLVQFQVAPLRSRPRLAAAKLKPLPPPQPVEKPAEAEAAPPSES